MAFARYLRRPWYRLILAAAALALLVFAWNYLDDPDGSTRTPVNASELRMGMEPKLRAFSIMKAQPQAMPPLTRAAVARILKTTPLPDINLEQARRVATPVGIDAWVLAGNGMLCVARDRTGTIGCNSTSEVNKRGMSLLEKQPPEADQRGARYLLLGITPDSVEKVRIRPDDGPPRTVPVIHNVYAYLGSSPAYAELIRHSRQPDADRTP